MNSMKSILASTQKDKVVSAFEEIGVSIYDVGDNGEKLQKNLDSLLAEVTAKWATFDQETRNKFAVNWAGAYQLNALTSLLNEAAPVYQKLMTDLASANNSLTTKLLTEGMTTYTTKVEQLAASWEVFSIALGEKALPEVKNMILMLTQGIQVMSKHSEEISNGVSWLLKIVTAVGAYKAALVLCNLQILKGVSLSTAFAAILGNTGAKAKIAAAGVDTMKGSVLGLTGALLAAAGRMVAFIALAETIGRVYNGSSYDSNVNEFLEGISGGGSRDAGASRELTPEENDIQASISEANAFLEDKRANRLIQDLSGATALSYITGQDVAVFSNGADQDKFNDMKAKTLSKINRYKTGKMLEGIQGQFDDFTKAKIEASSGAPVGDNNFDFGNSGGGSGGGASDTSGASLANTAERAKRIAAATEYKQLMSQLTVANTNYETRLEKLNETEAIHGETVDISLQKQAAYIARTQEMKEEVKKLTALKQKYESQLDSELDSQEFINEMQQIYADWTKKSKADQRQILLDRKEELQELITNKDLLEKIAGINEAIAKSTKDITKLRSTANQAAIGDSQNVLKQLERQKTLNGYVVDIQKANLNKNSPTYWLESTEVEIAALERELSTLQELEAYWQDEYKKAVAAGSEPSAIQKTSDALAGVQAQLAVNQAKLLETKDTWYTVREAAAGMFSDLVIDGNSWASTWKNLWNGIANDAIKALFRIQNTTPSLLSSLLGLFGGGGSNGAILGMGDAGRSIKEAHTGEYISAMAPKMHSGGRVNKTLSSNLKDDEVLRTLQVGERVLSKGTNEALESYIKSSSDSYVPSLKNPEMVNKAIQSTTSTAKLESLTAQTNSVLEKTNAINEVQIQLLSAIAKNMGNSGGTVAQPIVTQQAQSNDQLYTQLTRMRKLGYNV